METNAVIEHKTNALLIFTNPDVKKKVKINPTSKVETSKIKSWIWSVMPPQIFFHVTYAGLTKQYNKNQSSVLFSPSVDQVEKFLTPDSPTGSFSI